MAFYLVRNTIKKLPAAVIHDVPKPQPQVVEGFGSRSLVGKICKEEGFSSVLIVTDEILYSLGFHQTIVDSLNEHNISSCIFSNISSEPNLQIVKKGREAALSCNAQCIIALGGGSVMDASKMIAAWVKKPHSNVGCPKFLVASEGSLPMINIPTTAGTGAEITVGAIVKKAEHGQKNSTVIFGLDVRKVILDSELTLKSPSRVTAACGIDALSHGLEGVVGDVRVSVQDKQKSFECVKLVLENLGTVLDNPVKVEARQAMARAALYGGNAINKQLAGYVHAFAHSIGAKYNLAHGFAIATCLYPIMKYQEKHCIYQLAELAHYCGLAGLDVEDKDAADRVLDAVKALIDKTGITKLGIRIPKEDYKVLAKMIFKDSINYSVPVVFTKIDIYHLLDEINNL